MILNFDSLKDQLRDQWNELLGKIQENPTFQSFKEKFEALPSQTQQILIIVFIALVGFFVLSIPYSYISTSSENIAVFDENRGLIRDLLAASRTIKEPSPLPPGLSSEALKTQLQSILTENRLMPEQIVDLQAMSGRPAGKLVPPVIEQSGVAVSLKKLNLRQIVDIGHRFQSLNSGVKVLSMDIVRSASQTHYYDVVFKVVNFSLPNLTAGLLNSSGGGGKGGFSGRPGSTSGRKSQDSEEEPTDSPAETEEGAE